MTIVRPGPRAINPNAPLNKGLVAWYDFRQNTGLGELRDSWGKNHGTLNGSMTGSDWVTNPVTGSHALELDGTDDWVDIDGTTSADFMLLQPFTMSLWAHNTGTNAAYDTMLSIGRSFRPIELHVRQLNTGFGFERDNVQIQSDANVFRNEDGFQHIAGTFDGIDTMRLYHNGQEIASNSSSVSMSDASPATWRIGDNAAATNKFGGRISDVRIYNRALSPAAIRQLYQASRTGYRNEYRSTRRHFFVPAAPATTTGGVTYRSGRTLARPSYKSGYARSASESANPGLWRNVEALWSPSLGITGETLQDNSGNRNHGDLTSMEPELDWVTSRHGIALSFDGSTDYVATAGKLSAAAETDFTWAVFCRLSTTASFPMLMTYDNGTSENDVNLRFYSSTSQPEFIIGTSPMYVARSGTPVGTTSWNLLVGRLRGGVAECIVNGVVKASDTSAGTQFQGFDGATHTELGRRADGFYFPGEIIFAGQWSRALSTAEIRTLHIDPLAPFRRKSRIIAYSARTTPTITQGEINQSAILTSTLQGRTRGTAAGNGAMIKELLNVGKASGRVR